MLSRWRLLASVSVRRTLKLGVGPGEPLARFLTSSGQFAKTKGSIKRAGVMPKNWQTSVFRIGGLRDDAVLAVGKREVGESRTVHGWGVFEARSVLSVGLHLQPDDVPPRHANIVGWPQEKDAVIEKAQDLCALAVGLKLAEDL